MASKLRILGVANRTMQRAGFLKYLCVVAARAETSNLSALGDRLITSVTRLERCDPPYSQELLDYVRRRLTDRAYTNLRRAVLNEPPQSTSFEIQDLYLADEHLSSNTGKLVRKDWRFYPQLGTALDLIKPGTYSAMTRALALITLMQRDELAALDNYDPRHNPMLLDREQSALLLYCFLDNDAEVIRPLFEKVVELASPTFDEREAGDQLPGILRSAITRAHRGSLTVEDRERLEVLAKVADNIEAWRGRPYTGSNAREESIRPRLEPYCDLGLLTKPEKHRFRYTVPRALNVLLSEWPGADRTDHFLAECYFTTLAKMHSLEAKRASVDEAREALVDSSELLKSALEYTPIVELGLLAGIHLLFRRNRILEIKEADEILAAWQRQSPDSVRFTVDRMGNRAFVKFIKQRAQPSSAGR